MIVAILIRLQERNNNVIGVLGTSTVAAIVISPPALAHIFLNVYVSTILLPQVD